MLSASLNKTSLSLSLAVYGPLPCGQCHITSHSPPINDDHFNNKEWLHQCVQNVEWQPTDSKYRLNSKQWNVFKINIVVSVLSRLFYNGIKPSPVCIMKARPLCKIILFFFFSFYLDRKQTRKN